MWLIDPQNRLLARVMVNRIWHHLFGAGLVRTVDNFGAGGEPPSHPELLDYLASRFVELGWSIKSMIREIVLTRTYRQASSHNLKGDEVDPDNRLLWRANRRRLEAESYRDSVLAISGALDRTRGGPTLPLDIPESIALGFPTALTQDAKVNDKARVSDFFLQALNRPATKQEVHQALDFIAKFKEKLSRLPEASDQEFPRAKLVILVQQIERAAKRIYGVPEFRFYAIADGIKQLLFGRNTEIGLPQSDPRLNLLPLFS